MSSVPTLNTWTSADIDARLKESAALISEWTKLLDKAGKITLVFIFMNELCSLDLFIEKASNPSEIPVSDVEQHIRLVRFCARLVFAIDF